MNVAGKPQEGRSAQAVDFDRFRLRRFIDEVAGMGELEIHADAIELAGIAEKLEGNPKALLCRAAGPEKQEVVGSVMGSRSRLARAFGKTPGTLLAEIQRRLKTKPEIVDVSRAEAPCQQVVLTGDDADLTKLPVHLQHGQDGAPYISSSIDYVIDPKTGFTNVGLRRMMLRGRHEAGIDLVSPSDLRAIYEATAAQGKRLPVSFAVGAHPIDHVAGVMRLPIDELGIVASLRDAPLPVVKCVTNDIRVPADAEYVLEGYLDERGHVEPEGPYGEFLGYYGAVKRNPVFHLTAITRRNDALFQTSTIGGRTMGRTDTAQLSALRTEVMIWRALEGAVREPVNVYATTSSGGAFNVRDLKDGHFAFAVKWKPEKLWDIHTPQNQNEVVLSLFDARGKVVDTSHPSRFGFRELWIKGRDLYLNGTRIFLSAVPLDNAQVGGAWASYEAARESLERLKSFGINFVYTHNYGCEPGSHLSFAEILRAADDVGMLVALSQPHFSHYEWKSAEADQTNGYARHAEFYARMAQNHPSVVFYSMSHNATGYAEDMNPDMIDGIHDPRDPWALNNSKLALRAEAVVRHLDPSRIVYHHASGNLGSMHAINFYPNFVPIQELSDWFEHWAKQGVKPAFMCEYGAPFTWDWNYVSWMVPGPTRIRQRQSAVGVLPRGVECAVLWRPSLQDQRAREGQPALGSQSVPRRQPWHRWDYPYEVGSSRFDERFPVFAMYLTDNWRAFRGWGVSAISPWEYEHYWKPREGVNRGRTELKVDWENLQRPGFSPDYIEQRYERMDLAFEKADWIATAAAQALIRNNRPLLAFIGGKTEAFTSKDHVFHPGQTVEKQIIAINNSRQTVTCSCEWSFGLSQSVTGAKEVLLV
jgi:UbiD family decarboxylase